MVDKKLAKSKDIQLELKYRSIDDTDMRFRERLKDYAKHEIEQILSKYGFEINEVYTCIIKVED